MGGPAPNIPHCQPAAGIIEVDAKAKLALEQISDSLSAARRILVVTGAGISTSCGIPDFRSQGGSYTLAAAALRQSPRSANSMRCGGTTGKEMFDASVWNANDTRSSYLRFISNLKQAVSRVEQPSATHRFIKLLRDQRRLVRTYTQNVDGLERRAGLCTDIHRGPGSHSRFSKKALASRLSNYSSQGHAAFDGGCEVVPLHGDLDSLRCSVCQDTIKWEPSHCASMSAGEPSSCPNCTARSEIRTAAGRRGTGIGLLKPNLVLYGEEHPAGQLLESIIKQDIRVCPEILLIFGTSLKVHGLQRLVREFAKAVHSRKKPSGKVIFVNNTKPSQSFWSGIIDYWVNMECDDFIACMKGLRPDSWMRQGSLHYEIKKSLKESSAIEHNKPSQSSITKEASKKISDCRESSDKARQVLSELEPSQIRQGSRLSRVTIPPTEDFRSACAESKLKRKFEIFDEDTITLEPCYNTVPKRTKSSDDNPQAQFLHAKR